MGNDKWVEKIILISIIKSAVIVHDASAKLPSGLLQGNVHQYGNYDECLSSNSPSNDFQGRFCLTNVQVSIPDHLKALKFMKENLVLDEMFKSTFQDVRRRRNDLTNFYWVLLLGQVIFVVPRSSEIHWGLCVPSACTPQEIEFSLLQSLENVLEKTGIQVEVQVKDDQCSIRDDNWIFKLDSTAICVMWDEKFYHLNLFSNNGISFLFAALISFVLAVTAYDYLTPSKSEFKILIWERFADHLSSCSIIFRSTYLFTFHLP